MKNYELKPEDGRKSFYGKATVMECNGIKILKSYQTEVARIDENGKFFRMWADYSSTTMRHVNAFRINEGLQPLNKSEWLALPIDQYNPLADMIIDYKRNYVA